MLRAGVNIQGQKIYFNLENMVILWTNYSVDVKILKIKDIYFNFRIRHSLIFKTDRDVIIMAPDKTVLP